MARITDYRLSETIEYEHDGHSHFRDYSEVQNSRLVVELRVHLYLGVDLQICGWTPKIGMDP